MTSSPRQVILRGGEASEVNPESIRRCVDAPGTTENDLRVLHLVAGNLYGGVEAYLATLANSPAQRSHLEFEFGVCFPGRLRDELTAAGAIVHNLGAVRLSRPWTVVQARRNVARLIKERRFNAVAVHGCWPHVIFASGIRKTLAKFVHVLHDDVSKPGILDRLASRYPPDLILANSNFTSAGARKLFAGVDVEVCYLPVANAAVASDARSAVRSELGVEANRAIILQAGRLEPWKGHRVLLAALSELRELGNWECWIAGGPQRPHEAKYLAELKASVETLGLSNRVRFLGQRNDLRRLMAAVDIFCQPNLSPEPFGIVFIEALYAGLPVVTSNFGGGAEILADRYGCLVPPGDVAALADKLRNLVLSPAERIECARGAVARAIDLCNPDRHLSNFERIIRNLTASSPRRAPAAVQFDEVSSAPNSVAGPSILQ
jgi:glycosyltransferase involved in cell wall biosynthesis